MNSINHFTHVFTFLFILLVTGTAQAQTPTCSRLDSSMQAKSQKLINELHAYGCCTDTISECLKADNPSCKTPFFLAENICQLTKKGKKDDEIREIIAQRAKAMDKDAKVYSIEFRKDLIWGNPESKTILSVYLCGRCPYCSRHVPQLIHALEKSEIKDKVAINLRYFPIKSHDNSTPAALAIDAAAQMGQAWPYLIKSYENFDSFTLNKITVWAQELGLDTEKMNALMKDPETRNHIASSKKEGLMNGVTTTPTFFINGRRIQGHFDVDIIISILEEELAGTFNQDK